ncbi:hypothetical protein [uncultured Salinisphaera sp.]|uniref:hypothetical protein n=1 Tax=uncultured Salinisphaera sp. TaxID=359372 RepID=UPI0032B229F8
MSESLRSLCTEKNPLGRHWDELPGALSAQKQDRMPIIGPSRACASATGAIVEIVTSTEAISPRTTITALRAAAGK